MIKIIVGLGNHHKDYQFTRHNMGSRLLEDIALDTKCSMTLNPILGSRIGTMFLEEQSIKLVIPYIDINSSGLPIKKCLDYFQLKGEELLVVHDELELPCGSVKWKFGGSHKGHNGLRNIIDTLKTADFYRLRIGIDRVDDKKLIHDYVLSVPSNQQLLLLSEAFLYVRNCLPDIINKKFVNKL